MSIESEVETSVEEFSRQLGEAITGLPEYEAFIEAKEAVEDDEKVQEEIREFEQFREEFMLARQTGEATQEDLRELQERQQELHSLPKMSDFVTAQNELELRLQEINEEISAPLAIDFGQKAGGCCED